MIYLFQDLAVFLIEAKFISVHIFNVLKNDLYNSYKMIATGCADGNRCIYINQIF